MPKYLEVPDDFDLESFGELKSVIKPFQPEDVTGLKNKANELLSENKTMKQKFAEMEAQIKASGDTADKGGADKLKAMLEDATSKLKEREQQFESLRAEIKNTKLQGEAAKIAAALTKDARRAGLLAEKIQKRLDIDGDSLVVLDQGGRPTVSSIEDLTGSIRKDFDFLCDGSQATGGGAQGGGGGAPKPNTSGMTAKQKIDASRNN